MNQKYTSDTFLAKWLNEELTDAERLAFEKTPEFEEYSKIVDKMRLFEAPVFSKERVFEKIQQRLQKPSKVKRLIPNWMPAVAASVVLFLGVFYFFENETTYRTSYGAQKVFLLPDGSEVQLNAKSSIVFDEKAWKKGMRTLTLDGEGYFIVQKGSLFSVKTEAGKVQVLGTEFNVKRVDQYFEVRCFEGKVSVQKASEIQILTAGNGIRADEGQAMEFLEVKEVAPSWTVGESRFQDTPLKIVFEELERQYNLHIQTKDVDLNQRFTGSFTHANQETALQTVCLPMQLTYLARENSIVVTAN